MVEVGQVISFARQVYAIYEKFEETTDDLHIMRSKVEQMIPIIESIQLLYAQRDKKIFASVLARAMAVLQQCMKAVDNGTSNFMGLVKAVANSGEVRQLSTELGSIINQLTLAVVTWNSLGSVKSVKAEREIIKTTIVGASAAGKTCFVMAANTGVFKPGGEATIGASFTHLMSSETLAFQVWDTAGNHRYMGIAPMYTRGAKLIILLYDMTEKDKSTTIDWFEKVKTCVDPNTLLALVGNKKDLVELALSKRLITEDDLVWGPNFAQENNMVYLEVSCKTGENINYCLYKLFTRLVPATPTPQEEEKLAPLLSGYLHKVPGSRGNNIGGWQERFFVCNTADPTHVYYFRNNRDYRRNKFAGRIKFSEVTCVKIGDDTVKQNHSLVVITPKRTWYFYAANKDEQQKWLDFFCSICKERMSEEDDTPM